MNDFPQACGSTVIPTLRYRDADAAIGWLIEAFGFVEHFTARDDGGVVLHSQLTHGSGMVMLGQARDDEFGKLQAPLADASAPVSQSPYVIVDDVDRHYERAVAAGANIVKAPEEQGHGGKLYSCRDPEGNLWNFGGYDPWAPQA